MRANCCLSDVAWAGAGILVIGFFNFLVSAWLALLTAARARDLTREDRADAVEGAAAGVCGAAIAILLATGEGAEAV